MAFKFNWPRFDDKTIEEYKEKLTQLLNQASGDDRPSTIVGKICVTELCLGEQAPEIEILDMLEFSPENFKAVLKVSYEGECSIAISTQVKISPLGNSRNPNSELGLEKFGILAAHKSLVMPMTLRICKLELMGVLSVSISQENGVHAQFKNDPLRRISVESSFDEYPSIRRYLQRTIEGLLRGFLVDVFPNVVRRASSVLMQAAKSKLMTKSASLTEVSPNGQSQQRSSGQSVSQHPFACT
jgi:distribution and morphology protein 34